MTSPEQRHAELDTLGRRLAALIRASQDPNAVAATQTLRMAGQTHYGVSNGENVDVLWMHDEFRRLEAESLIGLTLGQIQVMGSSFHKWSWIVTHVKNPQFHTGGLHYDDKGTCTTATRAVFESKAAEQQEESELFASLVALRIFEMATRGLDIAPLTAALERFEAEKETHTVTLKTHDDYRTYGRIVQECYVEAHIQALERHITLMEVRLGFLSVAFEARERFAGIIKPSYDAFCVEMMETMVSDETMAKEHYECARHTLDLLTGFGGTVPLGGTAARPTLN